MQKHYIFDVFKGQTTPAVGNLLHKYNCFVICVPSYYTDNFQTLDNFLTKVQNVSLQTSNLNYLIIQLQITFNTLLVPIKC